MSSSGLRQSFTVMLVLTFFISSTALGQQVGPSVPASQPSLIDKAYLDAYTFLKESNTCRLQSSA